MQCIRDKLPIEKEMSRYVFDERCAGQHTLMLPYVVDCLQSRNGTGRQNETDSDSASDCVSASGSESG